MTATIAILIAIVALAISLISLIAVGTMAVKMRLAQPRAAPLQKTEAKEMTISTLGQSVEEVLAPIIDYPVPTADGDVMLRDMFLVDDGLILLVSTICSTCRILLRESRDALAAADVRVLAVAPTTERGREFVETDCQLEGVKYQVDVLGERARAMGVTDFPATLQIRQGLIAKAYVTASGGQLAWAIEDHERIRAEVGMETSERKSGVQ
ncbi:MAG: hypothetical protein QOJ73_3178 [Streptosporangiaceae bacterium]|nr:hypothetical protein [Streptosporangiaceae bacterium]